MEKDAAINKGLFYTILLAAIVLGAASFLYLINGQHPEKAWRAYHINFLLWSAVAQGGLLFSMVMHLCKARWSGPLAGLSEAFAGFFPVSFLLFLALFLGREHLFPWLHHDLHGKEVWLNMPFLFTRDFVGLVALYGLGFAYLFNSLKLKRVGWTRMSKDGHGRTPTGEDEAAIRSKMSLFAVLYSLAYALVLSLIGFDLVMSMDPHWISTLFGAYAFVKAFYIGLGALLILASIVYLIQGEASPLRPSHFHDLGKLFFGFCLVWADFFYAQFVVIWYGNLPEETHYVIQRTMTAPWKGLAWFVFVLCFIAPFFILLNKRVKTQPVFMLILASAIIVGIWLEHLLLLGPAWDAGAVRLPLGFWDALISLGFLGLMVASVTAFLKWFPELVPTRPAEVN
jgi:hypothetical protein